MQPPSEKTYHESLVDMLEGYWKIWVSNGRNYKYVFEFLSVASVVAFLYDELIKDGSASRLEDMGESAKKVLKKRVFEIMPGCSANNGLKYAKTIFLLDGYDQIIKDARV